MVMNLHYLSVRAIELWNGWEVLAMILLSLLLQIFLAITGSRRKYTTGFWFGMCVWLAYLSADWLATVTLGLLARSQGGSESNGTVISTSNASFIPAFWAPMLLIHLGGPETISAYALEDNELWSRHLLQLLTQLAVALYATLRSWWSKDPLIYLVIPIFVCGMMKYGERIWVLWFASSDQLRESAYEERRHLKLPIDHNLFRNTKDNMSTKQFDEVFSSNKITVPDLQRGNYLHEAHFLFPTLKLLFADYHVTFPQHMCSYLILRNKCATEAFDLIEVELGFMFDILFTKVMTSVCWLPRFILRFINFMFSVSTLLAFSLITSRNLDAYSESDMIISYLLLVGAIVLETYSAILTLFSDWAMIWISKQIRKPFGDRLLSLFSNNKRWKSSMAQHQLSIASPQRGRVRILMKKMHLWLNGWEVVDDDLKKLIFKHLLDKRKGYDAHQMHEDDVKIILEQRGGGVLKKKGCLDALGWSVSGEHDFQESLLIWHLAINKYFDEYSDYSNIYCKMTMSLSCYMMYLRKEMSFMLPKELGEGKYKFLSDWEPISENALHLRESWISGSLQMSKDDQWKMTSEVLVEMLCYAASHCGWKEHARALAQGGELLTFVAILMAHLGFSHQCLCPKKRIVI